MASSPLPTISPLLEHTPEQDVDSQAAAPSCTHRSQSPNSGSGLDGTLAGQQRGCETPSRGDGHDPDEHVPSLVSSTCLRQERGQRPQIELGRLSAERFWGRLHDITSPYERAAVRRDGERASYDVPRLPQTLHHAVATCPQDHRDRGCGVGDVRYDEHRAWGNDTPRATPIRLPRCCLEQHRGRRSGAPR